MSAAFPQWAVFVLYTLCLYLMFLYCTTQLTLTIVFQRNRKKKIKDKQIEHYPFVTIQLPVYNEKYVVCRLIECVIAMDYPPDRMEIQILDDSTDETPHLIETKLKEINDPRIHHLRRSNRTGFKAGALREGMKQARGEFIAIFDCDFLPPRYFLVRAMPHFDHPLVGLVQTRWGFLNDDYNLFTRIQAMALNAHFSVEHLGRKWAGSYINFNGTAGIFRRTCIENAGGWRSDTITEDIDLSYRAQMRGWQFRYVDRIVSPSELPVLMPDIMTQQFRWCKGAAENSVKHLGSLLSSHLNIGPKLFCMAHLLNSSVFLLILGAGVLSLPLLLILHHNEQIDQYHQLNGIPLVGLAGIGYYFWVSFKDYYKKRSLGYFLKYFVLLLIVFMGFSRNNSFAVIGGFVGKKSPFNRTPKYDLAKNLDGLKEKSYKIHPRLMEVCLDWGLCLYFLAGIILAFFLLEFSFILFHIMLCLGFGIVSLYSTRGYAKS